MLARRPAADGIAGKVVDPGALASLGVELVQTRHLLSSWSSSVFRSKARACWATFSGVKPKWARTCSARAGGAELVEGHGSVRPTGPAEAGRRFDGQHGCAGRRGPRAGSPFPAARTVPSWAWTPPGRAALRPRAAWPRRRRATLRSRCRSGRCRGRPRHPTSDVGAPVQLLGSLGRPFQYRDCLAGEDEGGGAVVVSIAALTA